ncbi:MAG: hypothetical protein R3B48_15530 [Kofleriaceae bacterium]
MSRAKRSKHLLWGVALLVAVASVKLWRAASEPAAEGPGRAQRTVAMPGGRAPAPPLFVARPLREPPAVALDGDDAAAVPSVVARPEREPALADPEGGVRSWSEHAITLPERSGR